MKLREVFFLLNADWDEEKKELIKELQAQGIGCYNLKQMEELQDREINNKNQADKCGQSAVLITDEQSAAALCRETIVCIGCDRKGHSFFEGAELVTDELRSLDGQMLEETLCHVHGYPVTIAETERLIIREIAECDFEGLRAMSGQDGMQHAFAEFSGRASETESAVNNERMSEDEGTVLGREGVSADEHMPGNKRIFGNAGVFDPERLAAYISQVYRFYGYGLWSVLKKDGTLIGCCGLSEFENAEHADKGDVHHEAEHVDKGDVLHEAEHADKGDVHHEAAVTNTCLELQYMLASEFQGKGYAQEMCRAVLRYAAERTDWDKVWIRVHRRNEKSKCLAKRLGFSECVDENGEIIFYVKEIERDAF